QRSGYECGLGWNSRRGTESSRRHRTLGSWCGCVSCGAMVRGGNRQIREDHGGTGLLRTGSSRSFRSWRYRSCRCSCSKLTWDQIARADADARSSSSRRVEGRAQPKPFWYWDKGELAIVGRTYAIAELRFSRLAGFVAWVIWAVVHIYFLIGFANRLFVLLLTFLTKRRRVRALSAESASDRNAIDPAA